MNSELQQDVRDVWAGLTVWQPNTAAVLQGATDVAFTVLDVLGYLDEIPVCVGYEIDGEVTTEFPTTHKLEKAKPVLKTLPGWKCDIRGIKNYEDLPENCRNYVEFIEEQIGLPDHHGQQMDREEMILFTDNLYRSVFAVGHVSETAVIRISR